MLTDVQPEAAKGSIFQSVTGWKVKVIFERWIVELRWNERCLYAAQ